MAYAPLVGQDGGNYGFDLADVASDLFLQRRLDRWNRLESAREIRAHAHGVLGIQLHGPGARHALICPSGNRIPAHAFPDKENRTTGPPAGSHRPS
jgi:hypothetical protein